MDFLAIGDTCGAPLSPPGDDEDLEGALALGRRIGPRRRDDDDVVVQKM